MALLVMTACSGGSAPPAGEDAPPPSAMTDAVELFPQPAYANNTLSVSLKRPAPPGEPIRYAYQWRINGQVVDGATGASLPVTSFHKGDVVLATVTAQNGPQQGITLTSAPLTILNSVPIVTGMGMTPTSLYHQTAVHAVPQGADVDGDTVSYGYQWFKNGVIIPDQAGDTLDGVLIKRGDRIHVRVVPYDGTAAGEPSQSREITVQNSPPRITSQPNAVISEDDTYVYAVTAEDVDGDPIVYSLSSAPEGMTIDAAQGLIRWQVTANDAGLHPIEVTVANADGAKTMQRYDLRIDDVTNTPAPPPS